MNLHHLQHTADPVVNTLQIIFINQFIQKLKPTLKISLVIFIISRVKPK
jgi:hypothetical protein